jgi:hypothetical protein
MCTGCDEVKLKIFLAWLRINICACKENIWRKDNVHREHANADQEPGEEIFNFAGPDLNATSTAVTKIRRLQKQMDTITKAYFHWWKSSMCTRSSEAKLRVSFPGSGSPYSPVKYSWVKNSVHTEQWNFFSFRHLSFEINEISTNMARGGS